MNTVIVRSRRFERHYRTRIAKNPSLRAAFRDAFDAFLEDPAGVHAHPLTGTMTGRCAYEVTEDVRVVYRIKEGYVVFLDVGTHEQVYT